MAEGEENITNEEQVEQQTEETPEEQPQGVEPTEDATKQLSRSEERIAELSRKVELSSKERDELTTLNKEVTKERDFFKDFSTMVGTYNAASEYQDEIRGKVMDSGYSVEDATIAVLGKAGKLGGGQVPTPSGPEGGSASTNITQEAQKPLKEMSRDELREQLLEIEKQGERII